MIGFLTTEYPGITQNYGGIGTSIKDLSNCLRDCRLNPLIILVNDDDDYVQNLDGVSIVKIKRIRFPGLTAFLTGFKVSKVVNELVRQGKMEVLEVPDWTGLSAFVKVNCPIVMRLNGSETYFKFLEGETAEFRYRFLEQRAFKGVDYLISVSQFTADVTNQIFNSNRIMEIIPNAVDSDLFIPSDIVAGQQTVLYFGTLTRKKGVFELPAIFGIVHKNNPDTKFLLIGRDNPDTLTGSKSTWMLLQNQFDAFGVSNVQYIPALPRHDLIDYIQRASICVFPSYAEALPVSWLEAMSCGKAVVASNIGWASEVIVDNQNGFLVHPADHMGFADKINLLLSDSELRTRVGVAAEHNIASSFTTKVIIDHYLKFYSKILGKSIAA